MANQNKIKLIKEIKGNGNISEILNKLNEIIEIEKYEIYRNVNYHDNILELNFEIITSNSEIDNYILSIDFEKSKGYILDIQEIEKSKNEKKDSNEIIIRASKEISLFDEGVFFYHSRFSLDDSKRKSSKKLIKYNKEIHNFLKSNYVFEENKK